MYRKLASIVIFAGVLAAPALSATTTEVVYIADSGNNRIREVDTTTGNIITFAGNGAFLFAGDGGPATSASLKNPTGVAVDPNTGDVYIADNQNNRIRVVYSATGKIATVAGTGLASYAGDGGPATSAQLNGPYSVAVDYEGANLYIADTNNNVIRGVNLSTGIITTVAGNGKCCYGGDGGPPTSAQLFHPKGVAVDVESDIVIADTGNSRIRWVPYGQNVILTAAGTGTAGYSCAPGQNPGANVSFSPAGIAAVQGLSVVVFSDSGNNCAHIAQLGPPSADLCCFGDGIGSYGGDGLDAFSSPAVELNSPAGLALDVSQNLYIADSVNSRIRLVMPGGNISTLAGNGAAGYSGDGGPATAAKLYSPTGVAVGYVPGELPF